MSKDTFANPQPPSNYVVTKTVDTSIDNLTNDDFRKLLMTPAASNSKPTPLSGASSAKVELNSSKKKFADEAVQRRKAKKLHYASLMKEVKEREEELAKKYRDRAKERRETDKTGIVPSVNTSSNYSAVAPDFSLTDNADRRLKIIEESKYLGGDLEHTHLVKGLDYALLQKVKAEIEKKEIELDNEELLDKDENAEVVDETEEESKTILKMKLSSKSSTSTIAKNFNMGFKSEADLKKSFVQQTKKLVSEKRPDSDNEDDSRIIFKSKLGRSVYRVLFEDEPPKINELFQPHRMAYIVDLTNEEGVDVPITSIRSKADCPSNESSSSITTNDIVINKLTQILSYLRHGKRDSKKNKKKAGLPPKFEQDKKLADPELSIYDDIGEYTPTISNKNGKKEATASDRKTSSKEYFDKDHQETSKEQGPSREAANEFIRNIVKGAEKQKLSTEEAKEKEKKSGMSISFDQDSYSECYPGTRAEEDVNIDSDEEADFSKMDLGNKKGPVNRWDFETEGEYTSYMNNREAMPKAAFQFGVKMGDGRKTRNKPGDQKSEAIQKKTKLDKEWNQISKIIDKRKTGDFGSFGSKKPKY